MKNGRTRVVVTGMGTVNPLGKNLDQYWDGLIEGRSTARMVEGSYPIPATPGVVPAFPSSPFREST